MSADLAFGPSPCLFLLRRSRIINTVGSQQCGCTLSDAMSIATTGSTLTNVFAVARLVNHDIIDVGACLRCAGQGTTGHRRLHLRQDCTRPVLDDVVTSVVPKSYAGVQLKL